MNKILIEDWAHTVSVGNIRFSPLGPLVQFSVLLEKVQDKVQISI